MLIFLVSTHTSPVEATSRHLATTGQRRDITAAAADPVDAGGHCNMPEGGRTRHLAVKGGHHIHRLGFTAGHTGPHSGFDHRLRHGRDDGFIEHAGNDVFLV